MREDERQPLLSEDGEDSNYLSVMAHYWSNTECDCTTDAVSSCLEVDNAVELRSRVPPEGLVYSWRHLHAYAKGPTRGSLWPSGGGRKKFRKHLLRDVSGEARPRELLAVMGASGAGKTTLLDALTFRTRISGGARDLNGRPLTAAALAALSAYVPQKDLFVGALTVREHLVFHAILRMERRYSYAQRMRRVEQVISEFSLSDCQNVVIGIPGRIKGISGGEMKRLAFASEVLTDPPLMFCDEPTSGLDSFMALTVLSALKKMARKGKTVVATVHQPSSEMYALFDRILLIAEGRVAFEGTPAEALTFFASMGAACPAGYNPADFFVQLLAVVPEREEDCRQTIELLCDRFQESEAGKTLQKAPANPHINGCAFAAAQPACEEPDLVVRQSPYKASWCGQFCAVLWRSWLSVIKEPVLMRMRMLQTVMISLMIGLVFFGQKNDEDGVMNMNGALIILITNMTFQNVFAVITVFCSELPVFRHEHFNGMYRTDVYFLGKTLAELPVFIAIPCLFTAVSYYMVGFNPEPSRFFTAVLIAGLVTCVATSFGYFISCISSSISVAMSMAQPFIFPFLLFGGFFVNVKSVPPFLNWLSSLSWFRYGNEALFINQWEGIGHITCPAANSSCPANGHVVLQTFDFQEADFTRDILGLVFLVLSFRGMALAALVLKSLRRSS